MLWLYRASCLSLGSSFICIFESQSILCTAGNNFRYSSASLATLPTWIACFAQSLRATKIDSQHVSERSGWNWSDLKVSGCMTHLITNKMLCILGGRKIYKLGLAFKFLRQRKPRSWKKVTTAKKIMFETLGPEQRWNIFLVAFPPASIGFLYLCHLCFLSFAFDTAKPG